MNRVIVKMKTPLGKKAKAKQCNLKNCRSTEPSNYDNINRPDLSLAGVCDPGKGADACLSWEISGHTPNQIPSGIDCSVGTSSSVLQAYQKAAAGAIASQDESSSTRGYLDQILAEVGSIMCHTGSAQQFQHTFSQHRSFSRRLG
ncbi:hypothetical protein KCU77_g23, partial [Aureobasidium melanogenum]